MAPSLAKHNIQFQIGDDLGRDHLPSKSQLMLHHIGIHLLTTPSTKNEDRAVKTRINQLHKQVKNELRIETQASWEIFCNSISLETDPSESRSKIKNFLKPKGQRNYPTLRHDDKVAKTNADKAQLFTKSVERHFGIENERFDLNHFNEVNQFIEDKYRYFYFPEDSEMTTGLTWQ